MTPPELAGDIALHLLADIQRRSPMTTEPDHDHRCHCGGELTEVGPTIPVYWPGDDDDLNAMRWRPVHNTGTETWTIHAEGMVDGKPSQFQVVPRMDREAAERICDSHNSVLDAS